MKLNKSPILDLSWLLVCLALGIALGSTCGCDDGPDQMPEPGTGSPALHGISSFKVDCGTLYYDRAYQTGVAMTFVPDGTCCTEQVQTNDNAKK